MVISIGLFFAFIILNYPECGTKDGPFVGKIINDYKFSKHILKKELDNGTLVIDNRGAEQSPIISLIVKGKTLWSFDTDTSTLMENTRITTLKDIKIINSNDPIELKFIAHWSFGPEQGTMTIDRKSGKNSYCLSW